jgi:hypothetical protein
MSASAAETAAVSRFAGHRCLLQCDTGRV